MKINIVDGPLYQWDTGRQITISDAHKEISEVHFSNLVIQDSLRIVPDTSRDTITVNIPDVLLQYPCSVNVYIHHRSADGEFTMYEEKLPVKPRPKPSDYIYTEDEIHSFLNLEKRVQELEKDKVVFADRPDIYHILNTVFEEEI